MSFLSPEFAFLALAFFPIYWSLGKYRLSQKIFLLFASYGLYATWSFQIAVFLAIYSVGIWCLGLWIQSDQNQALAPNKEPARSVRLKLSLSLIVALSLLFMTKYYDFFRELLLHLLPQLGLQAFLPAIDMIAPAGISFFTFQAITYLVWKKEEKSPTGLLDVTIYLSFWPTLFAGPIMRAKDFCHQINSAQFGGPTQPFKAIYYIFLGLFQKMVIASWLATNYVEPVFKYPEGFLAIDTLNAILAYTLQIFCDFSGYTLIVTGFGLLLGITLPLNFAQPYLSSNLKEFWRRWHISLSSFIRDYIYIPLGGNRTGFAWSQMNLLIAMLISGIWHGVGIGFVIWGLIHGLGMVLCNLFQRFFSYKVHPILAYSLTFGFVAFAWVFFKASSTEQALRIFANLNLQSGEFHVAWLYLWVFSLFFMLLSQQAKRLEDQIINRLQEAKLWLSIPIFCALGYVIILFSPTGIPAFIYYQF